MPPIRHVAICVFRNGNRILVVSGHDDLKNQPHFYRPLGGGVEFGELAVDALRREIREELGREIENPVQLGVLENLFEYRGQPGHEIVFVFDALFVDRNLYSERAIPVSEAGWDGDAEWLDLSQPLTAPLYPDGLEMLLAARD